MKLIAPLMICSILIVSTSSNLQSSEQSNSSSSLPSVLDLFFQRNNESESLAQFSFDRYRHIDPYALSRNSELHEPFDPANPNAPLKRKELYKDIQSLEHELLDSNSFENPLLRQESYSDHKTYAEGFLGERPHLRTNSSNNSRYMHTSQSKQSETPTKNCIVYNKAKIKSLREESLLKKRFKNAIIHQSAEFVHFILIESYVNLLWRYKNNMTPLHIVVNEILQLNQADKLKEEKERLAVARLLLRRDKNYHALDSNGMTVLEKTILAGHTTLLRLLCSFVNVKNQEGNRALQIASEQGDLKALGILIRAGATDKNQSCIALAKDEITRQYLANKLKLTLPRGQDQLDVKKKNHPTKKKEVLKRGFLLESNKKPQFKESRQQTKNANAIVEPLNKQLQHKLRPNEEEEQQKLQMSKPIASPLDQSAPSTTVSLEQAQPEPALLPIKPINDSNGQQIANEHTMSDELTNQLLDEVIKLKESLQKPKESKTGHKVSQDQTSSIKSTKSKRTGPLQSTSTSSIKQFCVPFSAEVEHSDDHTTIQVNPIDNNDKEVADDSTDLMAQLQAAQDEVTRLEKTLQHQESKQTRTELEKAKEQVTQLNELFKQTHSHQIIYHQDIHHSTVDVHEDNRQYCTHWLCKLACCFKCCRRCQEPCKNMRLKIGWSFC